MVGWWKFSNAGVLPAAHPATCAAAVHDAEEYALWLSPGDDPWYDEHNTFIMSPSRLPHEYQTLVPLQSYYDQPYILFSDDELDLLTVAGTPPLCAALHADSPASSSELPPLGPELSASGSQLILEAGAAPPALVAESSLAASPAATCTVQPSLSGAPNCTLASWGGKGSSLRCACVTCVPPPALEWFAVHAPTASEPATPPAQLAEAAVTQTAESEATAAAVPQPAGSAVLVAAATASPASSNAASAAAAVEAAVAPPPKGSGKACSQTARYGFAWISAEFGVVTGWDGPTVVVRLPDGRFVEVPAYCPCCGVPPYTSQDWDSGKLTKKGRPKKADMEDKDHPRNREGRCPDAASLVDWLQQHADLMSDDLMEFFHLLKSTLCRMRKAAGVESPRSNDQKAKAGRGNRRNPEAQAEGAPPAKRCKRRV